ncbi:MAG: hypothetical protein DRN08_06365 [Thermoplasmata archaeon]|nr:MAG: hypothetical protein DRN08_06365 [Thermoplasmata archaeon]
MRLLRSRFVNFLIFISAISLVFSFIFFIVLHKKTVEDYFVIFLKLFSLTLFMGFVYLLLNYFLDFLYSLSKSKLYQGVSTFILVVLLITVFVILKSEKTGLNFSVVKWIVYILILLPFFYLIFKILESLKNQIEYIKINYPEKWEELGKPYFTSDLAIKFMAPVRNKKEVFNFLVSKEGFEDATLKELSQRARRYIYMLMLYIGLGSVGYILAILFLLRSSRGF